MENLIDLSSQQKNILNTEIFYSKSSVNNICGYISINEAVDFGLLGLAANLYIKHTDSARLHLKNETSNPKQFVADFTPFDVKIYDVHSNDEVITIAKKSLSKPFNVFSDNLFRFLMFRFPDGKGGIVGVFHHLICDAYSFGILISRLMDIYSSLISSFKANSSDVSKKFISTNDKKVCHFSYDDVKNFDFLNEDFPSYVSNIVNTQSYFKSEKYKKDADFWNSLYFTKPNLTYIYNKSVVDDNLNGDRVSCKIDSNLNNKILDFCSKNNFSEYTFFMALFAIFLAKINDTDSCIIGSPVLNRTNYKEKQIAGMFVSTVPFPIKVNMDLTFSDFAKNVYAEQLSLFRHQKYPYLKLLQDIKEKFDMSQNLYDFAFSYQNARDNKNSSNIDYVSDWIPNNSVANSIEAHFYNMDDEDTPYIFYNYQTAKYSKEEVKNINDIIMSMAIEAIDNVKVGDIRIVSAYDLDIIAKCNDTDFKYDKNERLISIFEKRVKENKNKTAEIFKGKKITYSILDKNSNKVCNFLLDHNVKKNEVVAVILNRGFDLIYSMWGILKSGGCYLLVDPTLPDDRVQYMIENADCTKVIAQDEFVSKVDGMKLDIYNPREMENSSDKFTNIPVENTDRFCIIYTSGSTGKPKGIAIRRLGVVNLANVYKYQFNIDKCNTFLSVSTVAFDMFVVENFVSILNGKTVALADENEQKIPVFMSKLINETKPDFVLITPSKISLLVNEEPNCLKSFKIIQTGGEALDSGLYKKLRSNTTADLYDAYGPSETTVAASAKKIFDADDINIGKPILNYKMYIRNSRNDLMPIGFPGELIIEGDGVGIGYLHKYNFNGVYRSGDLAYINKNADVCYMGRRDSQIKLHGLRIELDEIKTQLMNYPGIRNAAIVIKKVNGIDTLCAYVESSSSTFDENAIKNELEKTLPYYMVPSHIILLDKLPITINGKIDLKHLPDIVSDAEKFVPLETKTEKTIADMWYKILLLDKSSVKLGKNSNLFELGGDSLCSIRFISEVFSKFKIDIDIKDVFEHPTIAEFARFIDEKIDSSKISQSISLNLENTSVNTNNNLTNSDLKIKKHEKRSYYPLSSAQKRIYFTSSMDEESLSYNTPFGIEFDKVPDINKLKFAFNKIVNSHESFRTSFELTNTDVSQIVADYIDYDLPINNFKNDNFVRKFDLTKAPLMHAELDIFDNKALLQVDIHHIIFDGVSIQIFAKELCDYYNNYDKYVSENNSVNDKKLDYIDFAINEKISNDDKNYWLSKFNDDVQILNMPTVYERPSIINHVGNSIYDSLDNSKYIDEFCKKNGVTPYMFLLACFYILLYKYTMQEEIVVGSPVSGRTRSEFSNTIGMFVNTLALKENITSSDRFSDFLANLRNNCIEDFSHQNYPFDELVKELNIKHDPSRNPLFDIMFTFESAGLPVLDFNGLKTTYDFPENKTSKFDISMEITPIVNNDSKDYQVRVEYLTSLYNEIFIKDFIDCYKNIILNVLNNSNIEIGKITMCSQEMVSKVEMYPKLDYPKDKVIIDLFNEQVKNNPNKIALYFGNQKFTYKDIDNKSNILANYIMSLDVYKNKILKDKHRVIGLLINRKPEMLISILAILKVGAGYIPIDPTYPSERISYILSNSETKLVLVEKDTENIAINNQLYNVDLKNTNKESKKYIIVDNNSVGSDVSHVDCISKPDDVSYMIYTSGSTGKPKGVLLKQGSVVNFIFGMNDRMPLKGKNIVNITTMCFDIFVLESLLPLCSGMTIILANNDEQNNPLLLNKLCLKYNAEVIQTTPSKFKFLMSDPDNIDFIKNMKIISLAGEPFTTDLYKQIKKIATHAKIFNMYGPTETTIGSTLKEITSDSSKVTIGTPISNTFTTILDKDLNPVPRYVPGLLYIGGDGVSIGYKNRDDLTKERYINYNGIRVYNSGDLARVLPIDSYNTKLMGTSSDLITYGEIDCLGRSDFQVKVHGLRIELGEIENDIRSYKDIKEAVVSVKNVSGRDILCGYFTANSRVSVSLLKQHLQEKLPRYMVPVSLVQLESFTYTPNGKIDRKVLPEPVFKNQKIVLPNTPLEQEILTIWKSILSLDEISTNDDFFDIGGDSLCALRLQLELMKIGYNVSYSDIFKYTTIKDLGKFIEDKNFIFINNSSNGDNVDDSSNNKTYSKKDFSKINKILRLNNTHRNLNVHESEIKNVLLVGATGFLGIHILAELLKIDNIKIYCLIRNDPSTSSENKLKNKFKYYFGTDLSFLFGKRIFVVDGDISYDMFNLTYDSYDEIGHKVYSVINCAAIVKHYGNYSTFDRVNVEGSKNVVSFCEAYGKKLYHISTLSVSGNTITGLAHSFMPKKKIYFAEKNLFINQSLDNVYVRSKFEAEKYILNEIYNHRLNGIILRLGNITNRFSDGKFQENKEENSFYNRIKAYIALGMIPQNALDGYVEFSPVDKVAESIITTMKYYENKTSVLHLYNSNHVDFKSLIKMLKDIGINISIVDENTFKNTLNKWFNSNAKFNKVSVLLNDLDKNRNIIFKTNLIVKNDFTLKYLSKTDFNWPVITEDYLKKILDNL